jgi:hypothetical protein
MYKEGKKRKKSHSSTVLETRLSSVIKDQSSHS